MSHDSGPRNLFEGLLLASFSNGSQSSILALIFNATTWSNIANNASVSPATQLYVSLHNADPGEAGNQTTNETAYTNYARVSVVRTSSGWTVSGSAPAQVTNVAAVNFPQCGVTGDTITHWGVGLAVSGAGTLLASGVVGSGPALEFTCTAASPGVLTVPNSGLAVNNRVSVYPTPTGSLPSGLTEGTVYFIGTAAGINVTLSTTSANGSPVNTSSVGSGVIITQAPLVVSNNIIPSFAINSLILKLWSLAGVALLAGATLLERFAGLMT